MVAPIVSLSEILKLTVDPCTVEPEGSYPIMGISGFARGPIKRQAISGADIRAMQLGLAHSLSRYKLKFSADKVDTMVIQAVGLLDELDKEINTYAMRVKEWYGWHFPGELVFT
jgi:nucleolar protein 58